jgi:multidrug efflux pump
MSISGPFIARAIATSLLMIAILICGVLAYHLLPVSSLPDVEYPTIQVSTVYPGASPEVIASAITSPLERYFAQMPGLNQMNSSSSYGMSVISLQFNLQISMDVAEQQVQQSINAASSYLPGNLPYPPIYSKVNPADTPIITFALTSKTWPLPKIEDYADTRLAPKLAQTIGVGLVSISGGQRPAVRIQVNPTALSAYGLSMEDVRAKIVSSNVNSAKGSFDGPRLSYVINSNDQLFTASQYRSLIISYVNGAPVRLVDIATVVDGAEDTMQAAWVNQEPAIIINIQRQPGANVIDVADSIKKLVEQLGPSIPAAINVELLSDRTLNIRSSVHNVQIDLLLSVVLVVLVIFLFLRKVSVTIIPSISVPLVLVGTLGVMYLLGFSLNNLTLMGLTIAAGFVVDDAIVMIENIIRYIELGENPLQAAYKGASQIGFTIVSLSISLIAVLIPLLFMGDVVGRLFREFALTLTITIIISAFISLTLTPMLCSRILKRSTTKRSHIEESLEQGLHFWVSKYQRSLQWVLSHQSVVLLAFLLTIVMSIILVITIPKGFFPTQDSGLILGVSEGAQNSSFTAMKKQQGAIAQVILNDPAVTSLSSFIGIDGSNKTLNTGRILIALKPLDERPEIGVVIQRIQEQLSKVIGATLYMQPAQDLRIDTVSTRTQYQYVISAHDVGELNHWSKKFFERLKSIPSLKDLNSDQQHRGLTTYVEVDRDTASRLGISMQMVDDVLYDSFGQRQVSTIYTQRNQYRVVLELEPKMQYSPLALENIYFHPNTGSTVSALDGTMPAIQDSVPLKSIARISQTVGPLEITRHDQFPSATLSFNIAPGASLGQAVNAIREAKQQLNPPASIEADFQGAAQSFQNALANEGWLVLAAILVVYIVLGVLYESYIHPLTILSTLPSASMGALLALYLTNNNLSIIALIAIILLLGLVLKNAIMMIDFALDQERTLKKKPIDAIYEAALLRFRPILMTTLASLLGAIPLALSYDVGGELRRPLGIAIIGGLLVSQLITLYTTPVIYLAFDRLSRKVMAWGQKE